MGVGALSKTQSSQVPILRQCVVAACLSILYLLLQLHFMPLYEDFDSSVYLGNVWQALHSINVLIFNPHHLHMEVGGMLFHQWMVKLLGRYGLTDLLFSLQLRSLVSACAGIFFAVLYLWDITGRAAWGVLGALLIGFCHGYMHYATKVDTGIFPAAAFLSIAWITNRITRANPRRVLWVSLAGALILFLGVMAHQHIAIACAAACISIALPPFLFRRRALFQLATLELPDKTATKPARDEKPFLRYASLLIVAGLGGGLIAGAYYYAGRVYYHLSFNQPTPQESRGLWRDFTFQKWLVAYATEGTWGQGLRYFNPKAPIKGFTDAFLTQPSGPKYYREYKFHYDMEHPLSEASFVHNQLAIFTLICVGGSLLFFPALWRRYGRGFVFLFLSLAAYAVFFTYWEPGYFEFWLLPSMQVCIAGVLLLNLLGERLAAILGKASHALPLAYFLVLLFLISSYNMRYYAAPYSRAQVTEGVVQKMTQESYAMLFGRPYLKNPPTLRVLQSAAVIVPSLPATENSPKP
jgi:hypothetical protein